MMPFLLQGNATRCGMRNYLRRLIIYLMGIRYVDANQLADQILLRESDSRGGLVGYGS